MNSRSIKVLATQTLAWITFFAIAAYSVNSVRTGTGPGGWLVDIMVRQFGDAYSFFAVFSLMVTLGVGAILLAWLMVKVYNGGKAPAGGSGIKDRIAALSAAADDRQLVLMSLGVAMLVCGAGTGIGGSLYLHWKNESARGGEFERVRLGSASTAAEPSGKFLALDATVRQRFTYTVTRTGRTWERADYYLLLTAPDWKPADPVSFVLVLENQPMKMKLSEITAPLYVEATRNNLPAFLISYYKKAGVSLATPYYAVTPMPVENGRVGTRQNDVITSLIVGAIFAAIGLLCTGIGYGAYRKHFREQSREQFTNVPANSTE